MTEFSNVIKCYFNNFFKKKLKFCLFDIFINITAINFQINIYIFRLFVETKSGECGFLIFEV